MTINKKSKILVFRTDKIGDLVNTSSFLKSLKSYYVNSEITLVCSNYNRPIAESYKFIDKIVVSWLVKYDHDHADISRSFHRGFDAARRFSRSRRRPYSGRRRRWRTRNGYTRFPPDMCYAYSGL